MCRAFATVGYCNQGTSCQERHVFECPDYSRDGQCLNGGCRLPHVDRARQLRQLDSQPKVSKVSANNDLNDTLNSSQNQNGADDDYLDFNKVSADDAVQADKGEGETLLEQSDFVHL